MTGVVQTTNWCFTFFDEPLNPLFTTVTDMVIGLDRFYEANKGVIGYICGQEEESPTTGAHHFQGYIQLKKRYRMLTLKKLFQSKTIHLESQKARSNSDARDYCRKEESRIGEFLEFGEFKVGRAGTKGARSNLEGLVQAIREEKTQRDIIESGDSELVETFATYLRFHDRVRGLYRPQSHEDGVKVVLYVGDPGTGKTRRAFEEFPDLFEIPISNGTLWLDGYDGQEHVLFDDFMGKGSKMGLDNTLKFFDRYVRSVPIKGAYVWWKPKVIVVTSNYHPRYWYKWQGREQSYEALCRRVHEVWVFDNSEVELQDDVKEYFFDRDQWPQLDVYGNYQ